jgi:peptidase S41-like protein
MLKKCIAILSIILLIILSGCNNAVTDTSSMQNEKNNNISQEKIEDNEILEENIERILPKYSTEKLLEDIDFLIKTIEEVHPNSYAYIDKDKFYEELNNTKSKINKPMNAMEFYKTVSPLVSLLKEGHTNIYIPQELFDKYMSVIDGKLFPLIVEIRDNKIFNTKVMNEDIHIPIGAEILAIDDIETEEIIKKLKIYETGMKDAYKEVKLEKDFYFLLWLEYGLLDEYKITYKYEDMTDTLVAKGVSKDKINSHFKNRFKDNTYYSYKILNDNICYLDFNYFGNYDCFNELLEEMFKVIKEKNINELIIDIRDNWGGKTALGDLLISYIYNKSFSQYKSIDQKISQQIIKRDNINDSSNVGQVVSYNGNPVFKSELNNRFKGKVCVLTNRYTFSSAALFASTIKDYNIGILIGEETGGLATTYGEVYKFNLPNSDLRCGVSRKYIVRPSGDETPKGVIPNHEIVQDSKDTDCDKDTVLEFAKKYILEDYDKEYNLLESNVDMSIQYIEVNDKDKKQLIKTVEKFYNGCFDNNYESIYEICSDESKKFLTDDKINKANNEVIAKIGKLKEITISNVCAIMKDDKIIKYCVEGKLICEKGDIPFKRILNYMKKIELIDAD